MASSHECRRPSVVLVVINSDSLLSGPPAVDAPLQETQP